MIEVTLEEICAERLRAAVDGANFFRLDVWWTSQMKRDLVVLLIYGWRNGLLCVILWMYLFSAVWFDLTTVTAEGKIHQNWCEPDLSAIRFMFLIISMQAKKETSLFFFFNTVWFTLAFRRSGSVFAFKINTFNQGCIKLIKHLFIYLFLLY